MTISEPCEVLLIEKSRGLNALLCPRHHFERFIYVFVRESVSGELQS